MKKAVSVILVLVFLSLTISAQTVRKNGPLQVNGTQLVNTHGNDIVLRGISFGWHSLWPRFYTKGSVKTLKKEWNTAVVRAALGVELGDLSYIKKTKYGLSKIETIIKAAIKNDVYVIVDWHTHNINLKEAKEFFDYISKKYGKYPNVIYEIFNEPDDETWEDVKAYSETIIKVIRKNDPDNIILVGTPHWCQDVHLAAENPIKGYKNIMYTMHFYAATHKKWLRDRVDDAIAKGLPVFVSESAGMEATGDGPMDYESWQEYIDWMEQRKISWVVWSISDKLETCSMLVPSANSKGKWKDTDIKPSGKKAKEYLFNLNNDDDVIKKNKLP